MRDGSQQLERSLLTRLVLDNYPLKLMALGLSVALFSLVHSDQDAQRAIYLDVVTLLPPPTSSQMLVSDLPSQVRVTLRGSRSRIASLQRDDFAPIQMDLRDPGKRRFVFDQNAIDVSGPMHVVAIEPPSFDLVWATRVTRRVPVRARLRGTPEAGTMIKQPVELSPSNVTIQGPQSEVDAITEVYSDEIPVEGLMKGVHERRVPLQPLTGGHVRYKDDPIVVAKVEVIAEQGERVLRHLELAVLGAAQATLRPNVVNVTLNGPVRDIADVEPDQVVPYVDLSTLTPNAPFAPLEVQLRGVPEGSKVARVSPSSVLAKRVR
jgi:YbbR domain-containing protein